ncbi:MAG: chorismate synthase, partial [Clostridia bacterium]|nr:chorismate synthase [Clostridia bacterium]
MDGGGQVRAVDEIADAVDRAEQNGRAPDHAVVRAGNRPSRAFPAEGDGIAQIGPVCDRGELLNSTAEKDFPVVDEERGSEMRAVIAAARAEGDSVGGAIECIVRGLPVGLGEPMFDGVENQIARLVFAVPAVKG